MSVVVDDLTAQRHAGASSRVLPLRRADDRPAGVQVETVTGGLPRYRLLLTLEEAAELARDLLEAVERGRRDELLRAERLDELEQLA